MQLQPDDFLIGLFGAGLDAVTPSKCIPSHLPKPPSGKTIVVGIGKAAAFMAQIVEETYAGPIETGLVVTRYHHGVLLKKIEVIEAAHPKPDEAGEKAARRMLQLVQTLGAQDLLLCLISGGGSALLPLPADGLTLKDVQEVSNALLTSGANIREFNCVRKHLSAISGGRLARATKARVVSLIVSDVPGNDLSAISSGPTAADPTTFADAREIINCYGIKISNAVKRHIELGEDETVKPGDPCLKNVENVLIATPQDALEAAASYARQQGIPPFILGNAIEGEAQELALSMAAMAKKIADYNQPMAAPCVLIYGGETTVAVKGNGKGGRNSEFLLHFLMATEGHPRIYALACGTDGSDGTEDNAGAMMGPDTLAKALAQGANPKEYALRNDSYSFFNLCDGIVRTGPTRTNVNDFHAIYISA